MPFADAPTFRGDEDLKVIHIPILRIRGRPSANIAFIFTFVYESIMLPNKY